MQKLQKIGLAVGMLIAASATPAIAGPAWEFDAPSNSFSDGDWDFAAVFTANSNVVASGLGYFADPTNGQVDANPVSLWQCATSSCDSGTLLASATVTNQYAIQDHFRYVTINPVQLAAGTTYEVAGESFGDNYTWDDANFHTDPSISYTLNSDRWLSEGSDQFLNSSYTENDVADGYWGPNVYLGNPTFTSTVPETATWAMMILGFGAIGGVMRRAHRKSEERFTAKVRAIAAA